MYLYFYRVRARSVGDVPNICRVFDHTLNLFQEPGWLGGSCVVSVDDPRDVLIYEQWGSLAGLSAWLTSAARQVAHRAIDPYLEGPAHEMTFREVD
ncbi:MAG: putative quinol monooxygenase [Chloroflexota bacterium]